jgi:UDP-GlcNAc:undecaprenyl-phosphate GlcNAc-1-phosphate transferase
MHDLSAFAKLALQCAAALLMASWGGVYVAELGDLFGLGGPLALGNFAIPFTLVCVLGIINGINMTDGIDGLAAGLTLVSLLAFATLFAELKLPSYLLIVSILIGAVVGFLCFNLRHPLRPQANIFLGDAGSMALGFALCWFAVSLTRVSGTTRVPPIAIVWLIAVPLLDMGVVILRRALSGKSPLAADREHLHHLLLRAGFSYAATTWTLLLANVICAGVGLAIWKYGIRDSWGFYGFIGMLVATLALTQVVKSRQARIASSQGSEDAASGPGTDSPVADSGVVLLREVDVREIRNR